MPQTLVRAGESLTYITLTLPDPDELVMPGVLWGRIDKLFTPAFWATLAWLGSDSERFSSQRLGRTVREEIAACVLGGYGISAEVGLAAFYYLRDLGLLSCASSPPTEEELVNALSQPITVCGRQVYYRFAKQRSRYLHVILSELATEDAPEGTPDCSGKYFRDWLLRLPGIGPKTASWIVRNWLASDEVAILDIHIFRAGVIAGVFRGTDSVVKNYFDLEARFLEFAQCINVRPSVLDALIWSQMRVAGPIARHIFGHSHGP